VWRYANTNTNTNTLHKHKYKKNTWLNGRTYAISLWYLNDVTEKETIKEASNVTT